MWPWQFEDIIQRGTYYTASSPGLNSQVPDKKKCELSATILQSRSFAFRGECVEEVKDFEGINSFLFYFLFSFIGLW